MTIYTGKCRCSPTRVRKLVTPLSIRVAGKDERSLFYIPLNKLTIHIVFKVMVLVECWSTEKLPSEASGTLEFQKSFTIIFSFIPLNKVNFDISHLAKKIVKYIGNRTKDVVSNRILRNKYYNDVSVIDLYEVVMLPEVPKSKKEDASEAQAQCGALSKTQSEKIIHA